MKHQDLISKMTLEEKAALLSGKDVWNTRDYPRLNIPSITCSDGPSAPTQQSDQQQGQESSKCNHNRNS